MVDISPRLSPQPHGVSGYDNSYLPVHVILIHSYDKKISGFSRIYTINQDSDFLVILNLCMK